MIVEAAQIDFSTLTGAVVLLNISYRDAVFIHLRMHLGRNKCILCVPQIHGPHHTVSWLHVLKSW